MPKFTITMVETVRYTVEVEAENRDAAIEAAGEIWANSPDPTHDFCGQGLGAEVQDVDDADGEEGGGNPFHPESPEGRAWAADQI